MDRKFATLQKKMMASSGKSNYVVNYFTLEIADIVNQSQTFPIYEVLNTQSNGIEIFSNDSKVEHLTIDNNNDNDGKINIIEGVIFANSAQELENSSANECELSDNEEEEEEEEDENVEEMDDDLADLTNLNWLTELKNITNLPPAAQDVPEKPCDPPSQRFEKFICQVNKMRENYEKKKDLYESDAVEKPPFNYAQIIGMALIEEGRMTLKQICEWIERRFAYYKFHKNWNVSYF